MNNPFLYRGKNPRHGDKAEKRTAKRLGGQLTPASGALLGAKGDIQLPGVLMENKATSKGSMSLKLDWLLKITQEALEKRKTPALAIQFVTENGEPIRGGNWVMVPEYTYNELKEHFDE
jgi:hypothetical protein